MFRVLLQVKVNPTARIVLVSHWMIFRVNIKANFPAPNWMKSNPMLQPSHALQLKVILMVNLANFAKLSPSPSFSQAELVLASASPTRPTGRPTGRPSGKVLSRHSITLTSKAKQLVFMNRPQKYLQTLTLFIIGPINPIIATQPSVLSKPSTTLTKKAKLSVLLISSTLNFFIFKFHQLQI